MVTTAAGNGNPITLSMSGGDTGDLVLNSTTPPAAVIVGPNGIAAGDVGHFIDTISAHQD